MIFDNVKVDESNLPLGIKKILDELKKLDRLAIDKYSELDYIFKLDELRITAKGYAIEGIISEKTYYKLMEKYGGEISES